MIYYSCEGHYWQIYSKVIGTRISLYVIWVISSPAVRRWNRMQDAHWWLCGTPWQSGWQLPRKGRRRPWCTNTRKRTATLPRNCCPARRPLLESWLQEKIKETYFIKNHNHILYILFMFYQSWHLTLQGKCQWQRGRESSVGSSGQLSACRVGQVSRPGSRANVRSFSMKLRWRWPASSTSELGRSWPRISWRRWWSLKE